MREARRLCAVTEAQLQTLQTQQGAATRQAALFGGAEGAEPRGRPAGAAAAGSHNLSHLRQVVERYILMDDGEETDALFQALFVVFTYHALLCTHPVRSRYICTQCAQNVCKEAVLALLGLLYTQSTHTQTHTRCCIPGDRHVLAVRRRDRARAAGGAPTQGRGAAWPHRSRVAALLPEMRYNFAGLTRGSAPPPPPPPAAAPAMLAAPRCSSMSNCLTLRGCFIPQSE